MASSPERSLLLPLSGGPHAFSAIAGLLDPVERLAPYGLHVRLVPIEEAETVLTVPLAHGLKAPIRVAEARRLQPGESVGLEPKVGGLALDGEREIELGPQTETEVRLDRNGPLTLNVGEVMREAALRGLLNSTPDST